MTNLPPQFWVDVEAALNEKLGALESLTFTELAALPDTTDHAHIRIQEQEVSFTLFVWQRVPGSVVVVLQAAVQGLLGFWRSLEKGFVAHEDGTKRSATQKEIESVL
jgi:hypothetical protein